MNGCLTVRCQSITRHGHVPRDGGLVRVDDPIFEDMYGLGADNSWRAIQYIPGAAFPRPQEPTPEPLAPEVVQFVNWFMQARRYKSYDLLAVYANRKHPPTLTDVYALLSDQAKYVREISTPRKRAAFLTAVASLFNQEHSGAAPLPQHTCLAEMIVLALRAGFSPKELSTAWRIPEELVWHVNEEWMRR